MQGALAQEWPALASKRNAADGPKGAPMKRHDRVAALAKGMAIACAPRLVLTLHGGSGRADIYESRH